MSGQPTAAQKEQYLQQVRQQVQATVMQEVMTKMTEKCFKVLPSFSVICSSLDNSMNQYICSMYHIAMRWKEGRSSG
jgi:hypothetical protein